MSPAARVLAVSAAFAASVGAAVVELTPEADDFGLGSDEAEFNDFIERFHKVYDSNAEREAHFAAFRTNLEFIRAENAEDRPYSLGITQFADLSPEEFGEIYGQPPMPLQPAGTHAATRLRSAFGGLPLLGKHSYGNGSLPDSVDWRQKGAVSQVKNQGRCGSCWAFATTGALESAWYLATGQLLSFSEQQLVDCSVDEGTKGCQGGAAELAIMYLVEDNKALCTEDSYPYQAADGACQDTSCRAGIAPYGVTGFKQVDHDEQDDNALMEAVAQQPVAVAIEADKKIFMLYSNGILTKKCGAKVDHAVLLVGYGNDDPDGNGTDYWLLKNSWGEDWGENGFVRIERGVKGTGKCGIKRDPVYPVVDGSKAAGMDYRVLLAKILLALAAAVAVITCCFCMRTLCRRRAREQQREAPLLGAAADHSGGHRLGGAAAAQAPQTQG